MAAPLRVFLSVDGVRKLLGQLTFQQIVVGRESPDGFTIPSPAVSREHGIFLSVDRHWFFKDLGSTNGTWLNNVQLEPGSLALLKEGDALVLGDSLLELASSEIGALPDQRSSAIAFLRDNFVGEFMLPESGPLLVVGGPKSHLKKDIAALELPGLVIERRGTELFALTVDPKADVLLNGSILRHPTSLRDRDLLKIQQYSIFMSVGADLAEFAATSVSIHDDEASFTSQGVPLKDWDDDLPKRAPERTNFGRVASEEPKVEHGATAVISRSRIKAEGAARQEEKLERVELSLIVGVAGLLVVVLLVLLFYWFFL